MPSPIGRGECQQGTTDRNVQNRWGCFICSAENKYHLATTNIDKYVASNMRSAEILRYSD